MLLKKITIRHGKIFTLEYDKNYFDKSKTFTNELIELFKIRIYHRTLKKIFKMILKQLLLKPVLFTDCVDVAQGSSGRGAEAFK